MNAVQNSMSALPQDQAQVSEAQRILDQQKYEQDKIQYEKDQKTYDEELLAYQAKQKEALDVKTKAEAKVKAEADAKAKAEADAKAQADAKALALSKEREAIETSYQTAIASNPHPAYLGTTSGGKGGGHTVPKPNISYYNYNAAAEKSKKSSLAGIAIRESGIILKSVGGISRSASNVLQGKSVGGDRHVTYQVGIVRANQNVTSGLISPSQYTQQVAQITQTYNQANQQFSIQTAKTASTNLRSLTIQQDTQRAIASQSGSAIGTISKSGIGSISQGSQVSVVNVSKQNLDVATTNYNKTVKTLDAFKETAPSTPTKPQRLTQASLKAISKVGGVSASDVNKFSNAPPTAPNQPTQQLQREGKITVTTPDGKTRTFKDRETADRFVATGIRPEAFQQYTVKTPDGKTRTFKDKETADRFVATGIRPDGFKKYTDYQDKTNPFNVIQAESGKQFTSDHNPLFEKMYSEADKFGRWVDEKGKDKTQSGFGQFSGKLYAGLYSQGASIVNLLADHQDSQIQQGLTPRGGNPANARPDYGKFRDPLFIPDTLLGKGIESGTELNPSIVTKYWDDLTLAQKGGELSSEIIPILATGGLGLIKRGLGITGEEITLHTTARTIAGAQVKDAVTVGKEFRLFGKTVASQTYKNPTTVVVKTLDDVVDVVPVNKSSNYSFSKIDPEKVLSRAELNPQGRGLEVMTGSKGQTRFNEGVINTLVKQGKMTPDNAQVILDVKRGVELARESPSIIHTGLGKQPLREIPPGKPTEALMGGLNITQSPTNILFKFKSRLGQLGGSAGQDVFLRPQYQKGVKHDLDIDAPKTKDAKRHTETIFQKMKQFSGTIVMGGKGIIKSSSGKKIEVVFGKTKTGFDIKQGAKNVFFHGTDLSSAKSIVNKLKLSKGGERTARQESRPARYTPDDTFFATPNPSLAEKYALKAVGDLDEKSMGIVKIELKDDAKVLRLKKIDPSKQELLDDIAKAKSDGYDAVLKPQGKTQKNLELIMFNKKIVKETSLIESRTVPAKGVKTDEFVELLDSKDTLKYSSKAQATGRRFGQLYRIDKLRSKLMTPLKEPDWNVKVRDIKDQVLAKASSVLSVQGKSTEKFVGEAGLWETKQNRLIDQGVLHIDSPALRGKDTVDLYKIFKSRALDLADDGKLAKAKELDAIAERNRARSPELDYSLKPDDSKMIKESSGFINEPSSVSLISKLSTPYKGVVPVSVSQSHRVSTSSSSPSSYRGTTSTITPKSVQSISVGVSKSVISPSVRSPSVKSINSKSPSMKSPSKSFSITSPGNIPRKSPGTSPGKYPGKSPGSPGIPGSPGKSPGKTPSRLIPTARNNSSSVVNRRRNVRGGLIILPKNKESEFWGKKGKQEDFVGNTRTDSLVGLINRKTTIGGDKTSQKATDLGNKMRLNPKMSKVGSKKKRQKKRQTDEMGKMFNKSKGLKI